MIEFKNFDSDSNGHNFELEQRFIDIEKELPDEELLNEWEEEELEEIND